jgi:23S rRNA pseudouridine1911/1915/1917 synthase
MMSAPLAGAKDAVFKHKPAAETKGSTLAQPKGGLQGRAALYRRLACRRMTWYAGRPMAAQPLPTPARAHGHCPGGWRRPHPSHDSLVISMNATQAIQLRAEVPYDLGGQRLDQVAAQLFSEFSRSRLTTWIKEGRLTVDDAVLRPRDTVHAGAMLALSAEQEAQGEWVAQDIPLDIVYEDEQILVINKPSGLVVHPAAGHADGTLLNALLHHVPDIINVPRAGIVHRLDKDTTGLMVVAKTLQAQTRLVEQLQARSVSRVYEAIVIGVIITGGTINAPIGRHGQQRQRMAIIEGGKPAVSHYRVLERFRSHTHVRVKLETGRTHQIRVHMAHIGYPLVGDPHYSGRFRIPPAASQTLVQSLREFPRQALHARFLELDHPVTGERMKWESPLPDDFVWLLTLLQQDREAFVG